MPDRTTPQIFDEIGDLIMDIERTSLNVRRSIKKLTKQERAVSNERMSALTASIEHLIDLVGPLRSTSRELFVKAITDGLTQLKNRGYFEEVIKNEIERIGNASCIMVDIDYFGHYNNTYGHQQGDKALQTAAQIIKGSAETDFIARYGGEEFSIILAGYASAKADASETAEKIRKNIEDAVVKPFSIEVMCEEKLAEALDGTTAARLIIERADDFFRREGLSPEEYQALLRHSFSMQRFVDEMDNVAVDRKQFSKSLRKARDYIRGLQKITVSVGAAKRKPGESVESLIYHADRALYTAKQQGRNRIYVL